jgi:FkbM family methyltransferase
MKSLGSLLLQLNQWRDAQRYRSVLRNGSEVYEQNCLSNSGERRSIVSTLEFRRGPSFRVRDGHSAAHTFYEIFLEDHYPRRLLRNAAVVVDVGANIGLFSYYSRLHASGARIFAFEADPATFALLSANVRGLRVDCWQCAVASFDGEIEFFSSPVSGWSSLYPVMGAAEGQMVKVSTVLLSRFLKHADIGCIDFLKVDVEGAEYDILLGDAELLSLDIRCLVVEVDRVPRDKRYEFRALVQKLQGKFRTVIERKQDSDFPLLICH